MRCPFALLLASVALAVPAQAQPPGPEARGGAGEPESSVPSVSPEEVGVEAAEEPGQQQQQQTRRRAAVLVVAASEGQEAAADALTEVLIGAVASRGGVDIVGKEELQALLHQGEARSLECVSSPPCLGRLGVQLRVAEAVVGLIARDADRWTFDLTRLEVRAGTVLGRVFREVEGDVADVAAAMLASVEELYRPPRRSARLRFAANVPVRLFVGEGAVGTFRRDPIRVEELEPGAVELRAEPLVAGYLPWTRVLELEEGADVRIEASLERAAPEPAVPPIPRGPRVSPLVWIGLGVAAGGGAVALGFGARSRREVPVGVNRAQAMAFVRERRRDALVANVALGGLALGVGLGVVGLALSDLRGRGDLRATIAPRPGGAQVVLEGAL